MIDYEAQKEHIQCTYNEKDMPMIKMEWILCPICGNKTCNRIREDTVLINCPLYCPKCKRETLISVQEMNILVIKEPDAQTLIR